jgi:hypothetical protein
VLAARPDPLTRDAAGVEEPADRRGSIDRVALAHVDSDQQWLRDELVVALAGVAPSRGGDDDAVDVAVAGGVEHPAAPPRMSMVRSWRRGSLSGLKHELCWRVWLLM